MPKVALYNQNGSTAGDIELNASVFGIEPNESVVFDAILMQRASLRQGSHKVKNRSEVRGGGRKPWRQRYRSCPSRFNPFTAMARRWCRIRPNTTRLFLQIT